MTTWITYERDENPGRYSSHALRDGNAKMREAARVISKHRTRDAAERSRRTITRSGRSPISVGVLCEE